MIDSDENRVARAGAEDEIASKWSLITSCDRIDHQVIVGIPSQLPRFGGVEAHLGTFIPSSEISHLEDLKSQ